MSHIRKTTNGRYEVRYRAADGRERARRFETKRAAQAYLDRVGVERQQGTWRVPRSGRMPLAEWVDVWRLTAVELRPSSRARDEAYLRTHVLPAFGAVPIGGITALDVRRWIAGLVNAGLAPATVHKAYQTLSKILRSAVDADLLAQSPCRRIPLPKIERQEMRFMTPAEIVELAEVFEPRYRALVTFDAFCGLRLSELAGLRRGAIDLDQRKVRVSENAVEVQGRIEWGTPKTRAGTRTIPMPTRVAEAMQAHLAMWVGPDPRDLVFAGADGGVLRASAFRSRFWNPAVFAVRLDGLRIHDMRHTAVSLWIAAGANPKQIATWAGHASVSVVLDRYGHLFEGHDTEVIGRLDELATPAP